MRVVASLAAALTLSGCVVSGGFFLTSPDPGLPSTYGSTSLSGGFIESVNVVAGGPIDASVIGPNCSGFINAASDFTLDYGTFGGGPGLLPLLLHTDSAADTTIVVYDPNGVWSCDDDGGRGVNALLQFNRPIPGIYKIWVGTATPGTANATLRIN